jgi:hypothetical protein
MPDQRDKPLFLARQGYRQRRVIDAARVLPVFGAFLLLVPMLWDLDGGGGAEAPGRLAERGIYIFAVWTLLVLAAAFLGGRLRDVARPPSGDPGTSQGTQVRAGAAGAPDDGAG